MRFSFVHIPKTGGTFFKRWVISASNKNSTSVEYLSHAYPYSVECLGWGSWENPQKIDKISLFNQYDPSSIETLVVTVRNPFSILKSYFLHETKAGESGWANCRTIHKSDSFQDFVDLYLDKNMSWHLPPMKKSLFSMIYDRGGKLVTDNMVVLKLEEFPKCIERFCADNDLDCGRNDIDKLEARGRGTNVSSLKLNLRYTDTQVKKLSELWQKDLERFGYKGEK